MNAVVSCHSLDEVRQFSDRLDREPIRLIAEHGACMRQTTLHPPPQSPSSH